MYSREERVKAIELYIKYDNCASEVIRELGYPKNRNSVRVWYKEYLKEKETGIIWEGYRKKPKYSQEQKRIAIDHFLEHGRNLSRTVRILGYPSKEMLRQWIDNLVPGSRKLRGNRVEYTQEQKIEAVAAMCARNGSARKVAEKYGTARECLYKWKKDLLGEDGFITMPKKSNQDLIEERDELRAELEQVKQDLYRAKLEVAILEKAAELIKKDPGIGPKDLTNKEKTILIDALKSEYPLPVLINMLDIARSSYYYQHSAIIKPDKYASVRKAAQDSFDSSNNSYGYRRILADIKHIIGTISEKVIRRIMKEEGLIVSIKRRRKYSSYQGEDNPAADNLLARDFRATAPNEKWLTDITEFHIPAGKVYLSPIVDCFDGLIPSWTIGTHPDAELVNTMLDIAIDTLDKREHPLVHSDRGSHYRWPGWISRMDKAGLVRSMSKKGCSPDNAACEGFFGRLKNEMFYSRSWTGVSIDEFIEILDSYIRWYNEKRIKISLGAMSPLQYRRSLGLIA